MFTVGVKVFKYNCCFNSYRIKHITILCIFDSPKMMKLFVFKKNVYFVSINIFYHISFTVDCRYFVISIITTYPVTNLKLWLNLISRLLLIDSIRIVSLWVRQECQ